MSFGNIFKTWDEYFILEQAGLAEWPHARLHRAMLAYRQQLLDARPPLPTLNKCEKCGRDITVMCFKGTGVCGELCRKLRAGEITLDQLVGHG